MPDLEPITGVPVPILGDPLAGLYSVPDIVYGLGPRTVQRYSTTATRDAQRPTPSRGEFAVVGTNVSNTFVCFYDGSTWRACSNTDAFPVADSGFPLGLSGVTASEVVANRITVAARPFSRRLTASASVFCLYTQAESIDAILYIGASVMGRTRQRMQTSIGESVAVVSNGVQLAADTSYVIELRVVRSGGTGAISTSVGSGLTTMQVALEPV